MRQTGEKSMLWEWYDLFYNMMIMCSEQQERFQDSLKIRGRYQLSQKLFEHTHIGALRQLYLKHNKHLVSSSSSIFLWLLGYLKDLCKKLIARTSSTKKIEQFSQNYWRCGGNNSHLLSSNPI